MDHNSHILDLQREQPDSAIVLTSPSTQLLDRTTLLSLQDPAQLAGLIEKFTQLKYRRERIEQFMHHLLYDPTSWWIDLGGDGVVYLTGVLPSGNANLNILFWDSKFTQERREVVRIVCATAMDLFDLPRVTALVHETNRHLKIFLDKTGFVYEGTIRQGALVDNGKRADLLMYGLLRDEMPPTLRLKL
jgi:RimJ/RimL family protein N-acetyltransferase